MIFMDPAFDFSWQHRCVALLCLQILDSAMTTILSGNNRLQGFCFLYFLLLNFDLHVHNLLSDSCHFLTSG